MAVDARVLRADLYLPIDGSAAAYGIIGGADRVLWSAAQSPSVMRQGPAILAAGAGTAPSSASSAVAELTALASGRGSLR